MQIDKSLFEKYNGIQLKSDGTLFGIEPIYAAKHKVCPFCFNKLYEMKNKPLLYCKSKKHKQKFIISKSKSFS